MNEKKQHPIQLEQEKLSTNMEILNQTEGFLKLTRRQQRIIKKSFYIQSCAERGTDPASLSAIESPDTHATHITKIHNEEHLQTMFDRGSQLDPITRGYRDSQNHIANWNCHGAIHTLEQEKGLGTKLEKLPNGFFEADYHKITDLNDLENIIYKHGVPCILHITTWPNNSNDGLHQEHSYLALGKDSTGKSVVWEKIDYGLPYQITYVNEVYNKYSDGDYYWGIRDPKTIE